MRNKSVLMRLSAVLIAFTILAAACGSDKKKDDAGGGGGGGGTQTTKKKDDGGGGGGDKSLKGLKGTTPLVDLDKTFKDRLLKVDGKLKDFNYAAESYDATVVIALATMMAESDGIEYAAEINGITRGGEKCADFAACKKIIEASGDPDYDGASGPLEFSGNGEPTVASYGILQFGSDNRIDDKKTEYQVANAPTEADVDQVKVEGDRKGDGELVIGTLLPQTGSLAFLGPPEFAGVDLAADEINAAGGVLDKPIKVVDGDSGDTETDKANTTVDRLLNSEKVDAIIGAASSGVTATVIDKITAAGVVQFSPANTSKTFSDYADKGLYFRDAPSDILQGGVLAEIIAGDGVTTVGILNLDDPYGTGLAEDLTKALKESGVEVVESITYDPAAQTFDAEIEKIAAADPEAIMVIGFDESSRVLTTMIEAGIGPSDKMVYGCDGNMGNALGENFEAGK